MERKRPEKVRQHTVPKRYLRGFTLDGERLIQFDRTSGQQCKVNVANASVVKRMYSIRRSDGEWDDSIEDYFMKLEEAAGSIFDGMVAGAIPTKQQKCIFGLYVARQMQRGRFTASYAQREAAKFQDHDFVLKFIDANRLEMAARYGKEELEVALREFRKSNGGVTIDEKTYLKWLIEVTPPYAANIADMHWRIETAKDAFFVTSDQPVCVRRRGEPVNPHVVGLLVDGAELYFPLNKNNMLVASQNCQREWRKKVSTSRVRELNRITVIGAFHFIFAPDIDPVVESLIQEHKEDRVQFKEVPWHG